MTRKERAEVYRKAARLIEDGKFFTCSAIAEAGGFHEAWNLRNFMPPLITQYISTFSGGEGELQGMFQRTDDPSACRILALCFMAALVDAGDA